MVIEIALIVMALAVAVLVGYIVPVLIQLRKTAAESERLIQRVNVELPVLLKEVSDTVRNMNLIATDLRDGAAKARVLGEAVGAVGETVNQIHDAVRSGAGSIMSNVTGWVSGMRAMLQTLKAGTTPSEHDTGNGRKEDGHD